MKSWALQLRIFGIFIFKPLLISIHIPFLNFKSKRSTFKPCSTSGMWGKCTRLCFGIAKSTQVQVRVLHQVVGVTMSHWLSSQLYKSIHISLFSFLAGSCDRFSGSWLGRAPSLSKNFVFVVLNFWEIELLLVETICKHEEAIRTQKTFQKNIFGGKRDFVKMCQVRCPKQPLKVPTP